MATNIKQQFAKQLETGKVVITDILETNNPDQKRIEVAQLVKNESPNLISIFQNTASGSVRVAWMPISVEMFTKGKFAVGKFVEDCIADQLNGNTVNVQVNESDKPFTWMEGTTLRVNKNAKKNKSGEDGNYLTVGDNYIFRQTSLVAGPAKDVIIKHDGMTSEAPDYDVLEAALQEEAAQIAN